MKKCVYCGKEFKSKYKRKYCSKQCNSKHLYEKKYIPKEKEERICPYCNTKFKAKGKQIYCSSECFNKQWYEKNYIPKGERTNICIFCGKEFITKKEAMYCSDSCREKYKRRQIKKYCLECHKELEIGKRKFCNEGCEKEYYIKDPRHIRACEYCGAQFKTNNYRQKLCSKECQNSYQSIKTLKDREQTFKRKFENKYPGFEYVEGYQGWRSIVNVKCSICGHIQERSAQCIKPEVKSELSCDNCTQIRAHKRALLNLLIKRRDDLTGIEEKTQRKIEEKRQRLERESLLKDKTCEECGKKYNATTLQQKYCSKQCADRVHDRNKDIRRRVRANKNGKANWGITLNKLIRRDKNTCHICGKKCNKEDYEIDKDNNFIVGPDYPSIDHVIPISKGGAHSWDNVKLAHHRCNTIKNDSDIYEEGTGQLTMAL